MLNTLKGKLLSATKNVDAPSQTEFISSHILPSNVVNVGADILKHFQNQWVELHTLNEYNVKKIEIIAEHIREVHDKTEKQKKDFASLNDWVGSLPCLTDNLTHCAERLSNVYSLCADIERELLQLEDFIEKTEFETRNMEQKDIQRSWVTILFERNSYNIDTHL